MEKIQGPYGLEIIQSCLTCPLHEDGLFCQLGVEALTELNTLRQTSAYPKGAVLFVEGQPAQGIFILCSGKAKLTAASPRGRSLIVRMAEPGEVLGLSEVVSSMSYGVSAETMEASQVSFLPREEFIRFLQKHGDVSVRVARHLSSELQRAYRQVTRIALAPTARAKLAGLLLDTASGSTEHGSDDRRFQLRMTHEEIGELIGSSRETVTRLLSEFQRKRLIHKRGALITLLNPARLESLLK